MSRSNGRQFAAKWDESKHPRKGGKFAKKGESTKGETKSEKEAKKPGKVSEDKPESINQKLNRAILGNVSRGMKADQAIDDILGLGTFQKLVSDLLDKLRGRGKPES